MNYTIVKLPDLNIVECESGLMKFYDKTDGYITSRRRSTRIVK